MTTRATVASQASPATEMAMMHANLETLRSSILLNGLQPAEFQRLAALVRRRTYRRGEAVFHRGDPADALHFVCHGRLKIVLPAESGGEAVLAIVGKGELFGELALLDGGPRSAAVVALECAETAVLGRRSTAGSAVYTGKKGGDLCRS